MTTNKQTASDVSAALAGIRRRARYMEQANGPWSWGQALSLVIGVGSAAYLMFISRSASDFPTETAGVILLVTAIGGWQHQRLKSRVDALTKLVSEMGYPDEA